MHPWALPRINNGDLPTWITAVVAFLALIAAVLAYRTQRRQIEDEKDLNKQQTDVLALYGKELLLAAAQRHRSQASRIVITFGRSELFQGRTPSMEWYAAWSFGATVLNRSDAHLRNLAVQWYQGDTPWGEPDRAVLVDPTPPGQGGPSFSRELRYEDSDGVDLDAVRIVATFEDAEGYQWRLLHDGTLQERWQTGWVTNTPPMP